jgi:hypothetical protein
MMLSFSIQRVILRYFKRLVCSCSSSFIHSVSSYSVICARCWGHHSETDPLSMVLRVLGSVGDRPLSPQRANCYGREARPWVVHQTGDPFLSFVLVPLLCDGQDQTKQTLSSFPPLCFAKGRGQRTLNVTIAQC